MHDELDPLEPVACFDRIRWLAYSVAVHRDVTTILRKSIAFYVVDVDRMMLMTTVVLLVW